MTETKNEMNVTEDVENISSVDFPFTVKQICDKFQKESNINEINISFHVTSIYNSTLFEAFSKMFQDMMPQNKSLSILIEKLTDSCNFEKAFLFDVFNKIYLAMDNSPNASQNYELCSDIIDVVLDMSGIYGDPSDEFYFDDKSTCSIKIFNHFTNTNNILFLKFIHKNLALIAIINEENYERNNLLDYNINIFRQGVKSILKIK